MNSHRTIYWAVAMLAVLVGPLVHAEGNGIALGNVSAAAKGKVIVPFMLELESEEIRVGSISASVAYNADVATFDMAEKGFLLDGVGGKVTATSKEDGEKSSVQVEVVTEGETGKPRQPLRKGLVLSLVFRIKEDAKADTKMPLELSNVKLLGLDAGASPIEPLTLAAGEIAVLAPENVPFVACFFFTH